MLALPPPHSPVSTPSQAFETLIESQDARWVVIAHHLDLSRVIRTRSFPTYQQARQYEADLHTRAAV